jgi:hypothetical protein
MKYGKKILENCGGMFRVTLFLLASSNTPASARKLTLTPEYPEYPRGLAKVADVFALAMLTVNLRRLPKLFAMQAALAGAG